jgi:hypothetical protein
MLALQSYHTKDTISFFCREWTWKAAFRTRAMNSCLAESPGSHGCVGEARLHIVRAAKLAVPQRCTKVAEREVAQQDFTTTIYDADTYRNTTEKTSAK